MGLPSLNPSACIGKPVRIYGLIDPRDRTMFYVGATSRPFHRRIASHLNDACHLQMRGERYDVIRSIVEAGFRPEIVELEFVQAGDWPEAEQFWIANMRFLGAKLVNKSCGGAGAAGMKWSSKTLGRRSEAMQGRALPQLHNREIWSATAEKNRHEIEVDGNRYRGIKVAALAIGIPYATLQFWLDTGRARRITGPKVGYVKPQPGLRRGKDHPNRRSVIVDGVTYWTVRSAAQALGRHPTTINNWLKSGRAHYTD